MEWPGTDKQKEKQLFIVTQNQKLLKDIYIFANKKKSLKFFIVLQKQRALIFLYFMEQSGSINKQFKRFYSYPETEIFKLEHFYIFIWKNIF